jgi:hypothetical protein
MVELLTLSLLSEVKICDQVAAKPLPNIKYLGFTLLFPFLKVIDHHTAAANNNSISMAAAAWQQTGHGTFVRTYRIE